MTAIVGILNKKAVAIAADSAMTVIRGDDRKIYNTTQKIFRLSKKQPVGVMVFNDAEFMGTPWEVLIKLYYDKSGDKDLPTVESYREDFISFLKNSKYFTTEEEQQDALNDEMTDVVYTIYRGAKKICKMAEEANLDELPAEKQLPFYNNYVKVLLESCADAGVCEDFERYTISQFRKYARPAFERLFKDMKEEKMPIDGVAWEKAVFAYIQSKNFRNFTGLVFVGYGSEQIYPALALIFINIAFDGHLRMQTDSERDVTISNDNDAEIRSYAQDDVIRTLLKGLAPDLEQQYKKFIQNKLNEVKSSFSDIAKKAKCSDSTLKKIAKIDEEDICNQICKDVNDYISDEYLKGLFRSIASFDVPDMASMAESLIAVTNLQRHITSSEESVGGPVDVAVITRSEGFVWIKHKNWFDK